MSHFFKKIIFSTVLFSLPLAAIASGSFKVALDWYINPDQAPILVAKAMGYYKQAGLNVKLLTPTNINEPLQLLAMQKVNVATTYAPRLVMDAAKGLPLTRIATEVPTPLDCLTSLKSSHILTPADLKGKTIGYSSGAFGNAMLKLMLGKYGLTLKDVHLVNIKMNLIQALLTHRVDATAGMMRFVEPVEIAHMGFPVRIFKPEQYGMPKYEELILIANAHTVNQPQYKQFVAATTKGVRYFKSHPEQSWKIVSRYFKSALAPTAHMEAINHAVWLAAVPYFTHNPAHLNVASYQALAAFLKHNHMIQSIPSPKTYLSKV